MEYSWNQIESATCLYQLRWIIVAVAFLAFLTRSRLIFLFGTMGAFTGFVIPEPVVYTEYANLEAALMIELADSAARVFYLGIIGSICGCIVGAALTLLSDKYKTKVVATDRSDQLERGSTAM